MSEQTKIIILILDVGNLMFSLLLVSTIFKSPSMPLLGGLMKVFFLTLGFFIFILSLTNLTCSLKYLIKGDNG